MYHLSICINTIIYYTMFERKVNNRASDKMKSRFQFYLFKLRFYPQKSRVNNAFHRILSSFPFVLDDEQVIRIKLKMQDIVSRLPPEIGLRIVLSLSLSTLASFQAVCSTWLHLVQAHEDMIYFRLAEIGAISNDSGEKDSLDKLCSRLESKYFGKTTWRGVENWKAFCHKQFKLNKNKSDPAMYLSRIYPNETPPRHTWRLKIDLKERLLLTTHRSPGLKVHDLDSMAELFLIQTVGPYTHLEYDPDAGIAVFDEDDDLEIWKLIRPSPGQDLSDFARGQFVKWGKIPAIPGMRGFHFKDGILAVVSQQGTTTYYDLVTSPDQPTLLQTLSHDRGAIGYLDKTPSTLVLCHDDLTRCYSPLNGSLLGTFPPPPTVSLAHYTIRRPEARRGLDELVSTDVVYTGMIESVDFEEIRPAAFYGGKEWKACHVDGPYLVILSDMSRLFVCTDYEAVLRAPEGEERERIVKSTCCVFDIEVGEINVDADPGMERYTGDTNWLSVCDGRAAFGAIDHVMILSLPPKSSTAYVKFPHALALPTARDMEISCLSLVPDGLFTIWGYLQRTSSSPGYHRMILRNAVRVLWFDGREKKIESEDRVLALERSATEIQMEAERWTASDDDGEEWTDDDGVEEWTDEEDD